MWSVGCIMGELIADHEKNKKINVTHPRRALFEGKACFPLSPPKGNKDITYKIENGFPQSEDDQMYCLLTQIKDPPSDWLTFCLGNFVHRGRRGSKLPQISSKVLKKEGKSDFLVLPT
jgi:hypothetical protein